MSMTVHTAAHIITGLWLIFTAYWFVRAFHNKRTVYRPNRFARSWYYFPPAVVWLIVMHWSPGRVRLLPPSWTVRILGVTLCAAGIAVAIWARTILGKNWSGQPTIKENHELIRRGPYAVVRHPIYTGILLALTGTLLALWPTLGGLILIATVVVALRVKARQEETLMTREFPDAYPAYRRRVRYAIIPRVL